MSNENLQTMMMQNYWGEKGDIWDLSSFKIDLWFSVHHHVMMHVQSLEHKTSV